MPQITPRTTNTRTNQGTGWRRPLLAAAGCSSSSTSSSSPSSAPPKGTANVAYASSLQYLNEKIVGPAFQKADGYKYSGRSGASGELSSNIASGEISPDVFESVGGDN